jgi:PHD/YefM family antitoxin component YafN of YafNO toxin-antitoxin module
MAKIINAAQARLNLNAPIDETVQNHEPIIIIGKRNNAVMICEKDWEAIQNMIDSQISNQRIDVIKSAKMEVETLDEVAKKLDLDNPV